MLESGLVGMVKLSNQRPYDWVQFLGLLLGIGQLLLDLRLTGVAIGSGLAVGILQYTHISMEV